MGVAENSAIVQELLHRAARHHGVFTRQDALKAGLGASAVDRLLRQGKWKTLHDGVYCAFGSTETRGRKIEAARLWAADDAVVSHFTAAELWGLAGLIRPTAIHLSTTHVHKPAPNYGIVLHRVKKLAATERRSHAGHLVTTPLRTLVDLAPLVSEKHLELAMLDARRRKLLSAEGLNSWVDGQDARRRWQLEKLVRVIEREALLIPTESPLEDELLQELINAGLRPPAGQAVLYDENGRIGRADLAFPDERLLIEVDGSIHDAELKKLEDAHRDARIHRVGYAVLRARRRHLSGVHRAAFLDALRRELRDAPMRTGRPDWPYSKLTYFEHLATGARKRRVCETGEPPAGSVMSSSGARPAEPRPRNAEPRCLL